MRRALDAVLLLDKPCGLSSNAALQEAKRLFRAAKAGHAGTLDPLASGLLPVLFGQATKFADVALGSDKEYEAHVRLGIATASGDAEGEIIGRRPVVVDGSRLEGALARFRGEIEQVPPMHSALKRGGRPLYALAREGKSVERAPRRVVIHELALLGREGDLLRLRIRCSKGTYIRQLAQDLGSALGTLAHLGALRRTAAAGFRVEQATGLEDLRRMTHEARLRRLLPVKCLLAGLPQVALGEAQAARFLDGQAVALEPPPPPGRCRAADPSGSLLGVGEIRAGGELLPVRLVARHAAGRGKQLK
jgi:tRNA pseudouridine55 synthase